MRVRLSQRSPEIKIDPLGSNFISNISCERRTLVRPFKEMSEKEKFIFLFPNDAERKGFAKQILTLAEITRNKNRAGLYALAFFINL